MRSLMKHVLLLGNQGAAGPLTPEQEAQALISSVGATIKRAWLPHLGVYQNSDGTTPAASNGDAVGYIPDWSASNDPAIQATADLKGVYRPTGVNGYPGVEVASADFYAFTTMSVTNFTIFIVAHNIEPRSASYILGNNSLGVFVGGSAVVGYGAFDGTALLAANTKPTTPEIFVFQNAKLWLNGVEATYSSTNTLSGLANINWIGRRDISNLQFIGLFGSIFICDSILSAANMNAIGNYLAGIYGKTWTTVP